MKSYETGMIVDIEDLNKSSETTTHNIPSNPSDIRNLEKSEIQTKLKNSIGSLVSISPKSIRIDDPLNTILDSLNMSQLKGMIEHEYHVRELSDLYLFKDTVTVRVLVEIVKLGYAPDDNEDSLNENVGATANSVGIAGALGCPPGVCCTIM